MKVTIHLGKNDRPVVVVEGDPVSDSPEAVTEAYLKIQKRLKEEETK